jgi:hypothetical protein
LIHITRMGAIAYFRLAHQSNNHTGSLTQKHIHTYIYIIVTPSHFLEVCNSVEYAHPPLMCNPHAPAQTHTTLWNSCMFFFGYKPRALHMCTKKQNNSQIYMFITFTLVSNGSLAYMKNYIAHYSGARKTKTTCQHICATTMRDITLIIPWVCLYGCTCCCNY